MHSLSKPIYEQVHPRRHTSSHTPASIFQLRRPPQVLECGDGQGYHFELAAALFVEPAALSARPLFRLVDHGLNQRLEVVHDAVAHDETGAMDHGDLRDAHPVLWRQVDA